jgi:ABC-type glucose/galactose transport system permease subunit
VTWFKTGGVVSGSVSFTVKVVGKPAAVKKLLERLALLLALSSRNTFVIVHVPGSLYLGIDKLIGVVTVTAPFGKLKPNTLCFPEGLLTVIKISKIPDKSSVTFMVAVTVASAVVTSTVAGLIVRVTRCGGVVSVWQKSAGAQKPSTTIHPQTHGLEIETRNFIVIPFAVKDRRNNGIGAPRCLGAVESQRTRSIIAAG